MRGIVIGCLISVAFWIILNIAYHAAFSPELAEVVLCKALIAIIAIVGAVLVSQ